MGDASSSRLTDSAERGPFHPQKANRNSDQASWLSAGVHQGAMSQVSLTNINYSSLRRLNPTKFIPEIFK